MINYLHSVNPIANTTDRPSITFRWSLIWSILDLYIVTFPIFCEEKHSCMLYFQVPSWETRRWCVTSDSISSINSSSKYGFSDLSSIPHFINLLDLWDIVSAQLVNKYMIRVINIFVDKTILDWGHKQNHLS